MKKSLRNLALATVLLLISSGFTSGLAAAQSVDLTDSQGYVTRGEAVDRVVKYFKLEEKNQKFLDGCNADLGECLFAFFARTDYDEYKLEPLIIYPDVFPAYKYYHSINVASELDLVRGYYGEDKSPFKPEQRITKAEALKLILGASGQLNWKDQFELSLPGETGLNNDEQKKVAEVAGVVSAAKLTWWYPRYLIKGLQIGLIKETQPYRPTEYLSESELEKLLNSSQSLIVNEDQASENPQENQSGNFTLKAERS